MADLKMIKVIKIGNLIPLGEYSEPLGRYRLVLNFPAGDRVVSLGCSVLSQGSFRIILNTDSMEDIHSFRLSENELTLNDEIKLSYSPQELYRQARIFEAIPGNTKDALIHKLIEDLLNTEWATLLSMINGSCGKLSAFDRELQKSLVNGLDALWQGDFRDFVTRIKGRGQGSTPSGDDFLIGYLIGLSWLEKAWGMDLKEQRETVYNGALGTNKLVNTFLYQAYSYLMDKNWADFLNCLAGNLVNRIEVVCDRLILLGETSGEDMLSGFFISVLWNRQDKESTKMLEYFGLKKAK